MPARLAEALTLENQPIVAADHRRQARRVDRSHPARTNLPLDGVTVGEGGLQAVQLVHVVGHGVLFRLAAP